MQLEIRFTEASKKDLHRLIKQEDWLALNRCLEALVERRDGAQLAGPLGECKEVRFRNKYVITFLHNEQANKVVVWGIRKVSKN